MPPPTVAVMTSVDVTFLFFPFSSDHVYYVNALASSRINMWKDGIPDRDVFSLLLGIVAEDSVTRSYRVDPTSMQEVCKIGVLLDCPCECLWYLLTVKV